MMSKFFFRFSTLIVFFNYFFFRAFMVIFQDATVDEMIIGEKVLLWVIRHFRKKCTFAAHFLKRSNYNE